MAVIKGDLETIREYFRKYPNDDLIRIVDVSKKSPLHHASREGRTSVADYLLTKGYQTNARERTLKTPLHYACLFGHAVLADLLLKRGGDLTAKDCSGRTCFHFACCSWSNESISLILGLKPELVSLGDNIGRTGLHYAVWNSCDAQVDIIRTIIERGGNLNQTDDYGKTALHYAAEGGRQRAIPILIQKGADMSMRETRTHKTPLELACNERTRELMVVYSSAPYTLKSKDRSFLDSAVKGQGVVVQKETLFKEEKMQPKSRLDVSQSVRGPSNGNGLVPEYWRSKMIGIMEQLQQIGVRSHQHIRRPYLFTGSWMEGVTTIEQLYDRVKDITANEAMLRLFNIMQPFEGDMPTENKDDIAVSNFYGEYYNFELPKETRVDLSAIGNNVIEQSKIGSMQTALEASNRKNEELQGKIDALVKDSQEYDKIIAGLKSKTSQFETMKSQFDKMQETVRLKQSDLLDEQKRREEGMDALKKELLGKDKTIEALQKDLEERDIQLAKLKKDLTGAKVQIKTLESKLKDTPDIGAMSSMKVMNKFERKKYVSQELSPEDNLVIQSLMKKVRGNPPDMLTRMRNEDKNADGLIGSYEFLQFLEKLKVGNDEALLIRKIAGFPKYDEIYIEDFNELVMRKMKLDSHTENAILEEFVTSFHKQNKLVDDVFKNFDKNEDLLLDLEEFKHLTQELGLTLEDQKISSLFNILDEDGSGSISIIELKVKLAAKEREGSGFSPKHIKEAEDKIKDKTDGLANKEIKPKINSKLSSVVNKVRAVDAFDDGLDKNRDTLDQVPESDRLKEIIAKNSKGDEFLKINDIEPLVGEIKVQFQKISNIKVNTSDFTSFFLLIRLAGITKNWLEKEIYPHGLTAFKYAMRISIINVLAENVGGSLILKFVGVNKESNRVDLGSSQIGWKKGLEVPNEWVVNETLTFEGGANKPNPCDLKIQLKWITAGSQEFKASVYDDYYLKKGFVAPRTEEGFLQINLASALLKGSPVNVSLKVTTPDQKAYSESPEKVIDEEHQFKKQYVVPLSFLKEDTLHSVHIHAKSGKEVLGEVYINWLECLFFTKELCENKAFLLYKEKTKTQHKVYMRFQFITKTQAQIMGIDGKSGVAKAKESFVTGVMKVGVVRARNLVGDEEGKDGKMTSDPLVVVKFKNHDKVVKITTDDVEQNLNPIWNEHVTFNVKILNDGAPPPFDVEVFDKDTLSGNDLIGKTVVRSNPCFEKPGDWSLNGFFPLKDKENKGSAGEIYLRACFVPEGQFDSNKNPVDVETNETFIIKFNKAKLYFRMVAGRDLVYLKDGIPQPKMSPYCEIQFPNGKSKSTKSVSDSMNPNWFYNYTGTIDIPESGKLDPVPVKIYHSAGMLSKNVLLSQVKVDINKCLENRGKWIINEMFTIPGEEKFLRPNNLKDMGKVYIQAKVVESSRIDDEIEPEMLIEMPNIKAGEVKGIVLIYVFHCKDLPTVDSNLIGSNSCDALVQFTTRGGDKVETPVIWGDLNPIFNTRLLMSYKVSEASEIEEMLVTVFDQDRLSGKDKIGSVTADLASCISKPNEWAFNKICKIEGIEKKYKKKGESPEVYFALKFLPEGQVDNGELPNVLEDLGRTVKDRRREGTLVVRIIHARGLIRGDTGMMGSLSDPYVEIEMPPTGKKYSTDVVKNTLTPYWGKEIRHPVDISDERYVDKAVLKVWDSDSGMTDDLIGQVDIDIRPVINDKNVWKINQPIELGGPEKVKEKLKVKNFGFVYVQMLYFPKGEPITEKQPEIVEDIKELMKASEISGTFFVKVVHAKDLMRGDKPFFGKGLGSSDPFVRIKWPNGKSSDTEKRSGTITPVWNQLLQQQVGLNKLNIPMLFLEVYDWDPASNDLLGSCNIDVDECVMNPGKWKINGNVKLEGGPEFIKDYKYFGDVYIQVMFLEGKTPKHDGQFPPVTENLKEIVERSKIKGNIEINLVHAEKVKAIDSNGKSDPYVIFIMPDKTEKRSEIINNSLNPIWNQKIVYPMEFESAEIEPIGVKVLDSDTLNPDDPLGKTSINISECVKNSGKWMIDGAFKLEPMKSEEKKDEDPDEKVEPEDLGNIYLQIRFVQDGMTDNTPPPPPKKDLSKQLQEVRIDGTLVVYLVHCKGLLVENPKSCKVFASIGIEGQSFEDTNYGHNRNPLFNFLFKKPLKLESPDFLKPLIVKVYEKGLIMKSTIGELTVDLKEVVSKENLNKWSMNKIYPINGPQDLFKKFGGKLGEVYLQAKLIPAGEKEIGERPALLEDIKQTTQSERLKGKLIVYVISVMDVIPEDGKTADPFVQVNFDSKTLKTEYKEKTLNASFNKKLIFDVDFESLEFVPPLSVDVKDHDVTFNDDLGHVSIDVKDCFNNPSNID